MIKKMHEMLRKNIIKLIWLVSLVLSCILIGKYILELFNTLYIENYKKDNSYLLDISSYFMIIVIIVPSIDLFQQMYKLGKYKNFKQSIQQKAIKIIANYLFILVMTTIAISGVGFICDFHDKSSELTYYVEQYNESQEDNVEIIEYINYRFLDGKKYTYWKNNTMYRNGEFSEEFIDFYETRKREDLKKILYFDSDSVGNCLIEDIYFVVQTITTLGYGNITPNYPIGMILVSCATLFGQFITIIGVVLIVRDDYKDSIIQEKQY